MRKLTIFGAHAALWTASLAGAFLLRFEFNIPGEYGSYFWRWLALLVACRAVAFFAAGLYSDIWRYSGARALVSVGKATALSSIAYAFAISLIGGHPAHPRSIFVLEAVIALLLVAGVRFAFRTFNAHAHQFGRVEEGAQQPKRLLVIGAGDAGEMLIREVIRRHQRRYVPVGFLDDEPSKHHKRIHDVPVLGGIDRLPEVVAQFQVEEAIIAIPSATGLQMRRIVDRCKAAGVSFKTIPGIDHLIDGRVAVSQVREVAIEDLLGREAITLDMASISYAMTGNVVLVSGAGGSIGSEICRQVCRFDPAALILVERAENNLFNIHSELERVFPHLRIVPRLADVADVPRMDEVFAKYRPAVVFHAAAHKHVPMLEWNPAEGIQNNVFGTKAIADLSDHYRVERFVMISTDKAVNPTSVMGTTKRLAEMYVQALAQRSKTRFVTVRFGNVLGSAGSVIPVFREQIARGGPVTITDPEMKRYFMTIPEASQLVLQAGAMGQGGEIFILDMGEPVKIVDLARDLITLSGLTPDVDIELRFTGLRPGEKLFEEIAVGAENAEKTRHPKIFVGRCRRVGWDVVTRHLAALDALEKVTPEDIRQLLTELVPEYTPVVPDVPPKPSLVPALAVTRVAATA